MIALVLYLLGVLGLLSVTVLMERGEVQWRVAAWSIVLWPLAAVVVIVVAGWTLAVRAASAASPAPRPGAGLASSRPTPPSPPGGGEAKAPASPARSFGGEGEARHEP